MSKDDYCVAAQDMMYKAKKLCLKGIDDLDGPAGTIGLTDAEIDAIMNYEFLWGVGLWGVDPRTQIDVIAQCECGKDKHGFANHSTWCPKHE